MNLARPTWSLNPMDHPYVNNRALLGTLRLLSTAEAGRESRSSDV